MLRDQLATDHQGAIYPIISLGVSSYQRFNKAIYNPEFEVLGFANESQIQAFVVPVAQQVDVQQQANAQAGGSRLGSRRSYCAERDVCSARPGRSARSGGSRNASSGAPSAASRPGRSAPRSAPGMAAPRPTATSPQLPAQQPYAGQPPAQQPYAGQPPLSSHRHPLSHNNRRGSPRSVTTGMAAPYRTARGSSPRGSSPRGSSPEEKSPKQTLRRRRKPVKSS